MGQTIGKHVTGQDIDLNKVVLADEALIEFPNNVFNDLTVQYLDISNNQLKDLPKSIGMLVQLIFLNARNNKITDIPIEIKNLKFLQILNLSGNRLQRIPDCFEDFNNLQLIDLSDNQLSVVPESLGACQNLTDILVQKNRITDFPNQLGNCKSLKRFTFNHNVYLNMTFSKFKELDATINAQHIVSFLEYRRLHNLNSRFFMKFNEGRVYYLDHVLQRTSWIDPRFYEYVRTLHCDDRVEFNMEEDSYSYPVDLTITSVQQGIKKMMELEKKTLDMKLIKNLSAGSGQAMTASAQRHIEDELRLIEQLISPQHGVIKMNDLSPTFQSILRFEIEMSCSRENCTGKTSQLCPYRLCNACCRNPHCQYHNIREDGIQQPNMKSAQGKRSNSGSITREEFIRRKKLEQEQARQYKQQQQQRQIRKQDRARQALVNQQGKRIQQRESNEDINSQSSESESQNERYTPRQGRDSIKLVQDKRIKHNQQKEGKKRDNEIRIHSDKRSNKRSDKQNSRNSQVLSPRNERQNTPTSPTRSLSPQDTHIQSSSSINEQRRSSHQDHSQRQSDRNDRRNINNDTTSHEQERRERNERQQSQQSSSAQQQPPVVYGPPSILPPCNIDIQMPFVQRMQELRAYLSLCRGKEPQKWSEKPRMRCFVNRTSLLEDSFSVFMNASVEKMKLRLNVQFAGEDGIDYGGLTREWFSMIMPEITNPEYALFSSGAAEMSSMFADEEEGDDEADQGDEKSKDKTGDNIGKHKSSGSHKKKTSVSQGQQDTNQGSYSFPTVGGSNPYVYHINPLSSINPDHLHYFRFVGRVLGKALFENQLVNVHFSPLIYKTLLNQPFQLRDLEEVDTELYKSLIYVTENDPSDLQLDFTTNEREFDVVRVVELKLGGKDILVTERNKDEYVKLMIAHKLSYKVHHQMKAMQRGFADVVPEACMHSFSAAELELLLCGTSRIDLIDWRKNTDYTGGYKSDSPQITFFWQVVEEMEDDERAKLLQFVTGTTRLPPGGFAKLIGSSGPRRFTIFRSQKPLTFLPSSHSCFNQLDLPVYPSKSILAQRLNTALQEGSTGFYDR